MCGVYKCVCVWMGPCKYLHTSMMCYQQRETILAKPKKNNTHLRTWPNFFMQIRVRRLHCLCFCWYFTFFQSFISLICCRYCLEFIMNLCKIFKFHLDNNTTLLSTYRCAANLVTFIFLPTELHR